MILGSLLSKLRNLHNLFHRAGAFADSEFTAAAFALAVALRLGASKRRFEITRRIF